MFDLIKPGSLFYVSGRRAVSGDEQEGSAAVPCDGCLPACLLLVWIYLDALAVVEATGALILCRNCARQPAQLREAA